MVESDGLDRRDALFLKRLERRKNGKAHAYWALVESFRAAVGRGIGWLPTWASCAEANRAAERNCVNGG